MHAIRMRLKHLSRVGAIVGLVLGMLPVTSHAEVPPLRSREVVYKRVGGADLRLHVFGVGDDPATPPRPGIVFFFAGGWKTGTPEQFFAQCEYLAARGMVAVSAEYRIASVHQTTPREAVQDAKSALRYLRQNAGSLGLDPSRLVAAGGSSGGHLAAACALVPEFDEPGESLETSCRPDALILFNPVIDTSPSEKGGYGHNRMKEYSNAISPQEHIRAGLPPTLFLIGSKDRLIPLTTALRFQRTMEEQGNRCDLFIYGGADHGFFQYKKRERGHYAQTVAAVDAFLVSLGFLSPR
ncbi:MAG: alpha/beta hydrolase [Opitutaceae bacterium]